MRTKEVRIPEVGNSSVSDIFEPKDEVSSPETLRPRQPASPSVGLEDYLRQRDQEGRWNISRHPDGRPSHILGGRIKIRPGRNGFDELVEIASLLGVKGELRATDSAGANVFQMEQYHSGYRVYGAGIKAFATQDRSEIYHVASELRVIERADLNLRIRAQEAVRRVQEAFDLDASVKIHVSPEPLIYGTNESDNHLVWRLQFTTTHPRFMSHETLVSALTGDIQDRPIHR